jgi:hypothetical protein
MSVARVFLDTNVLVYLFDEDSPTLAPEAALAAVTSLAAFPPAKERLSPLVPALGPTSLDGRIWQCYCRIGYFS